MRQDWCVGFSCGRGLVGVFGISVGGTGVGVLDLAVLKVSQGWWVGFGCGSKGF